jgi:drug/metabolite transporter (DMT)-like permease
MTLFSVICLIWGSSWIALKTGVALVPPVIFSGSRFVVGGGFLFILLACRKHLPRVDLSDSPRLCFVSLLFVPIHGLLAWGTSHVSSGVAAVVNLSAIPAALLIIGAILGEEYLTLKKTIFVAIGTSGIIVLFVERFSQPSRNLEMELLGYLAVVGSAVAYALGSVLSRPLLRRYKALHVACLSSLIGGAMLMITSLALEPGGVYALKRLEEPDALISWLYLTVFGSVVAYVAFLELVRKWGPSRAGSYAFVSPIVAVFLGMLVRGETVEPSEVVGISIALTGTALMLFASHKPRQYTV